MARRPLIDFQTAKARYNVSNGAGMKVGSKAAFRQSFYDFQTYAYAGTTTLYTFFQQPVGQSGKTLEDTNMSIGGQLSLGNDFLIESIQVHFYPGVLNQPNEDTAAPFAAPQFINDVAALNKKGYLTVNVLNSVVLTEAPIGRLPPNTRLTGNAAMSGTIAGSTASSFNQASFATFGGETYDVEGLWIPSNTNFSVNLNFPTTAALPSSVDGRIGIVLQGILYRNIQ